MSVSSWIVGCLSLWLLAGCASVREERAFEAWARLEAVRAEKPGLPAIGESAGLADYLAYAALNNPGLEAAFNRWKAALERVPQVRTLPNPRFNYRYFIENVETRVGPQRHSFGLSQTFPWFGKLALRGDVALAAAQAARQHYEMQKLTLFYRVKNTYYEYYYLARAVEVVRETRDLLKYLEQVARTRYKAAAAGHPDVIRAQVELGRLEDRLSALLALQGPTVARLNAALNRPIQAPLPWPKSIPLEPVAVTDEQVLTWFREASPELKALQHEIAKERHAIDLAKKAYYPDFTLGLDYIDTGTARGRGVHNSGRDAVAAVIGIELPIWRGKYQAGEREARARHQAALKAREDRENVLGSEIKLALYHFRDAERKINLYRDTLLPKAKQSLKATEAAFRAGRASFLDLVDAERVLLEFQLSYERALSNRAQRLAELEALVGREMTRPDTQSRADEEKRKGDRP